jgi:hypothetical protein
MYLVMYPHTQSQVRRWSADGVRSGIVECLPGGQEGSSFGGFSLSLAVATESESDRAFAALAEGGQVQMPLTKTFWSARFGMLIDRFGIGWMVSVTPNPFVKRAPFGSAPGVQQREAHEASGIVDRT